MTKLNCDCPVCGESVNLPEGVEVSEIVTCLGCQTRLVVEKIEGDKITLSEAPEVDEDWGE